MVATHPPILPLPVARLFGVLVGACLLGVGAVSLSPMMNGGTEQELASAVKAGLMAGIVVFGSGVLAVLVMKSVLNTSEPNLGTGVLAFSFVRMFGTLGGALVVVSALEPARSPFVTALLVSAMSALCVETLILRRWSMLEQAPPSPGVQ
jgi:hypothetical protein